MPITQEQYSQMLARTQKVAARAPHDDHVERESDLHEQIMDYCRGKGWAFFHGSMAHRSMRTIGEPDFIIAAEGGVTFYVECKRRLAKLTFEQACTIAMLEKLGQRVGVVRSLDDFVALVK